MFVPFLVLLFVFSSILFISAVIFAAEGEMKLAGILATLLLLFSLAIYGLFVASANDLNANYSNESRHTNVIAQIKSVSEEYVVLSNGEQYITQKMSDKSIIKNISVGDVVEVVCFGSKTNMQYIYSIKKLKVEFGK